MNWTVLAAHYGLAAVEGWTRVPVGGHRRGLLGHASWLTTTSDAVHSSPVHRGLWVLDRLLCDDPGTQPPGVPPLDETASGTTVREALAAHRADPACAGCHDAIDPIGLTLEPFDAQGRYRTTYDDGLPVEPGGTLPDGTVLTDHHDLAAALAGDPRVARCLAEHVQVWGLGRTGEAEADRCATDSLLEDAGRATLNDLVRALVLRDASRQVGPGETP